MAAVESSRGNLTSGDFISFFSAMMLMLQPVRRITNVNATIQRGVAAGDSLFQVIDADNEDDSGTVVLDELRGHVEFCEVALAYGDNNDAVLTDVSITVEPNVLEISVNFAVAMKGNWTSAEVKPI